MTLEEIRKAGIRHLWICTLTIAALHIALVAGGKFIGFDDYINYRKASSWAVAFSFLEINAVTWMWSWIVAKHKDYLSTFHTAVSGFRMLLVLVILGIIAAVLGRDQVVPYVVAFLAYYFVLLILHSLFFTKMANKLFR